MIEIVVNGAARRMEEPVTVEDLVEELACGRRGVAVAVNSTVVARSRWLATPLAAGDQVEVLHAVQGGC